MERLYITPIICVLRMSNFMVQPINEAKAHLEKKNSYTLDVPTTN